MMGIIHEWCKVNTDGSAIENLTPTGGAGIIRNEWGDWIKGFQSRIVINNSLVAEIWAIWDDLSMAANIDINDLLMESDA